MGIRGQYELIDTQSANVLGVYETEAAALRDVAEEIAAFGSDAPEVLALALIRLDVPAAQGRVAAGKALIARAQDAMSVPGHHARG
jgi:hypothetical protein